MHVGKKLRHCCDTLRDKIACAKLWSIGLFATEAVDHVSARLQHLDVAGHSMRELVSPHGVVYGFHQHTWSLLNPASDLGSDAHRLKLAALVSYFASLPTGGGTESEIYEDLRGYVLSVSAAVWARLDLKYASWPWRLFRGIIGEEFARFS